MPIYQFALGSLSALPRSIYVASLACILLPPPSPSAAHCKETRQGLFGRMCTVLGAVQVRTAYSNSTKKYCPRRGDDTSFGEGGRGDADTVPFRSCLLPTCIKSAWYVPGDRCGAV